MKKSLYFGFAALAALAFTACQKEVAVNEPSKEMVTVTLKAEKPGDATRTAAVEGTDKVSYEWTAEDKANLKVFIVGEDEQGKEKLTEVTDRVVSISDDNKVLTVTATVEESSTLRTAVSNAWTGSNKPKINANQSPKTDNYDAGADVIVAADVTVEDGLDEALLDFSRPVTINKMTLKNMVAGEKVYEVKITSDQHLTGYYENGVMKAQDQTLTLTYDDVVVGTNGEFPVYFVAMPKEGHTLTVTVKSDRFVYSKTFGPVNFTVGKFSKFGVKLPAGVPVVDTDYTGDWVITGMNGNAAFAAQAYVDGDNNLKALGVNLDKDNEKILSTKVDEIKMHFEKVTEGEYAGLYTIKDASGNYLYPAGTSGKTQNTLKGTATLGGADYYWSVEKELDGTYSIKATNSSNNNVMQFNSGNSIFSCYGSASQKPVTLYPYSWVEEDETPVTGYSFKKVAAVTSGKQYLIVAKNGNELKAAVPITGSYGYPAVVTVEENDGVITVNDLTNAFTLTDETSGYTIKQSDNRFWYQTGSYNNFNVSASPSAGQYFSISANADGTFTVTNLNVNKYLQYSTSHNSYGSYSNEQGVMPFLYELQDGGDTPVVTTYSITVNPSTNGSVSASPTTAAAGTEITLTVSPATGYELNTLTVTDAAGAAVPVTDNKFTMPASNVTVAATFKEKQQEGEHTATVTFGSQTGQVKINQASVDFVDSENNNWNVTTEGTTSFTPNSGYSQVGSSKNPATSITFTATLSSDVTVKSFSMTFGGYSGTAGDISVKVGSNEIASGVLNGTEDVTVESSTTATGSMITVSVTNIAKGVKIYGFEWTYE